MRTELFLFNFLALPFSSDFLVSTLFLWPLDGAQYNTLPRAGAAFITLQRESQVGLPNSNKNGRLLIKLAFQTNTYFMGYHTLKKLLVVYLKFKFKQVSCILSGSLNQRGLLGISR